MATHTRGRPPDQQARQLVIEAAAERFIRDGFSRTTMADIARDAGVAVQTIYTAFGSKVGVLAAAHDVAVNRSTDSVPLLDRGWFASLAESASVAEACERTVNHVTESSVRVAPIYTAIQRASSDPEVDTLFRSLGDQRQRFSRSLAGRLAHVPGVSKAVDLQQLSDVLYASLSVENYNLFVTEAGWSVEKWRRWLRGSLATALTED